MSLFSVMRTLLSSGPSELERQQAKIAADDKNLVDKIQLARDMVQQRTSVANSLQKEMDKCTRELGALRARCPNGALSRDVERQAKRLFSLLQASTKRLEFNEQYIDKWNQKIIIYEELRDNMRIAASHHKINAGGHDVPLSIDIDSLQDDVAIDEEIQSDLQKHTLQITQSLTSSSKPSSLAPADAAFDSEFHKLWSSFGAPVSAPLATSAAANAPATPTAKAIVNTRPPPGAIVARRNPTLSLN